MHSALNPVTNCVICGKTMPEGEEMFRYHGFSGKCPAPPTREWLDRPFKEHGRAIAEHHAKIAVAKIECEPLNPVTPAHRGT